LLVIPAIDIMGQQCVRLVKGDPMNLKVYFDNPAEAAKLFESQGAKLLHLVDLDAALGSGQNMAPIREILANLRVKVQIGGGIRTLERAETLLQLGVSRVIFGTASIKNPEIVEETISRHGSNRVAVALDERKGKAAFHGWQDESEINYLDFARSIEAMGVGAIIFTTIDVDGTLKGPQVRKIIRLVETVEVPVIASGGVANLNDLAILADTGVEGVVVGTALYEGKFTLEQAKEVVQKC
jgi:phosphoribosylformimino-5-aminoimidazole carboxamide ribotide isomerase